MYIVVTRSQTLSSQGAYRLEIISARLKMLLNSVILWPILSARIHNSHRAYNTAE